MEINNYHPFRTPAAKERFLESYEALVKKWPVPSQTKYITTSYGQTFVRISGPTKGQPIVLLHGHSENSLNWLPNIEDLSQNYETYAVDIVSDPGRSVYTKILKSVDDYVTWLNELFDGLGLDRGINLIGLSYGGWLTSQYALCFPQRLNKIVLIAPGGIAPFRLKFIVFAMFLSLFKFRIKFLIRCFNRWMLKDFLEIQEQGEKKFDEWFNFLYLGLQSHKSQPIVFAKVLTDEQLSQLRTPTLFLTGENEIIYSTPQAIKRIQAFAPWIKIQIIEHAGHDLTLVQPKKVNSAILNFLKKVF